jgi:hypothetical protein
VTINTILAQFFLLSSCQYATQIETDHVIATSIPTSQGKVEENEMAKIIKPKAINTLYVKVPMRNIFSSFGNVCVK